jgi:hypothetical protein
VFSPGICEIIETHYDSIVQVHTAQQDQLKEAYGETFGTVMKHVVIPFMRNPEQGSLSTLYAATSDDIDKNGWLVPNS